MAAGGDFSKIRFTFQEYFKRMTEDAKGWGEPMSALLGAYTAQIGFGLPSIGGKDSMSGFLCSGCGKTAGYYYTGIQEERQ